MDNTILAGKYIRQIMIDNQELMGLISANKIFPLLANPDTSFPFIVYSRTNLIPTYTKDLLTDNYVSFVVVVVSDNYVQSLNIANAVRHSLEGYRYQDNDIKIYPIKFDSITEETMEDAYIQRLSFSFNAG